MAGNYLFAGSDSGGERAASIYSLIGTAKLNRLDPEPYLRDVLTRIVDHPINRIGESLSREFHFGPSSTLQYIPTTMLLVPKLNLFPRSSGVSGSIRRWN